MVDMDRNTHVAPHGCSASCGARTILASEKEVAPQSRSSAGHLFGDIKVTTNFGLLNTPNFPTKSKEVTPIKVNSLRRSEVLHLRHAKHVVSAIHPNNLARGKRPRIRGKIHGRTANRFKRCV